MKKKYENLFFQLQNQPLSSVPYHENIENIERFFCEFFPLHLAVHKVSFESPNFLKYTRLHKHDKDELNIIISEDSNLEYLLQIEDEEYKITSNSAVYIPKNHMHSANVIKGRGFYIALRLE
jgi:hypothetical protein